MDGENDYRIALSATVIMALLFLSLACIYFIVRDSGFVLYIRFELLWCCRLSIRSANSFLYNSRSVLGKCVMCFCLDDKVNP